MTLDMCGRSYLETFQLIKDAVEDFQDHKGNMVIFFDSNEQEKCRMTKGFVEKVLGYSIIEVMHEAA